MSKGWKLGIGIPLLLLGLLLAGSMGLALAFLGTDGRFTSPQLRAAGSGVAIVAEDIRFEDLPDARETFTQLQATIRLDLRSADEDLFVGIAAAADAEEYLDGAAIDVVTDLEPFGVRTRMVPGAAGDVDPPGTQDIWVASTDSGRPLEWTLVPGDWWLVVMNADGSAGVDVAGTAAVEVPVVSAVVIVFLIVGLALLAGGLGFVISAARTGPRGAATPPPPPPVAGGRPAPPRPDAFG